MGDDNQAFAASSCDVRPVLSRFFLTRQSLIQPI